ncbi:VOC family protein [Bacillus sp. IITD106]|nr:VOC family protein [Bacillus sp. IITD106]
MNNEQYSLWQGFHHIALVTRDLDETIRFYKNLLGMQVGTVYPAFKQRGRHCFIKPGNVETWGIHFFEYPDAQVFRSDEELKRLSENPETSDLYSFLPGALQHIAFAVRSEEEGLNLREKLRSEGIIMTEIYDQGRIRNFIFTDNNGIQLEVTWKKSIIS